MSWGTVGAVNRALSFLMFWVFFQSCTFKTTALGGRAGLMTLPRIAAIRSV